MNYIIDRETFINNLNQTLYDKIYEAPFATDVNWGNSLIGRLINSTLRKAKISVNCGRMKLLGAKLRLIFQSWLDRAIMANLDADAKGKVNIMQQSQLAKEIDETINDINNVETIDAENIDTIEENVQFILQFIPYYKNILQANGVTDNTINNVLDDILNTTKQAEETITVTKNLILANNITKEDFNPNANLDEDDNTESETENKEEETNNQEQTNTSQVITFSTKNNDIDNKIVDNMCKLLLFISKVYNGVKNIGFDEVEINNKPKAIEPAKNSNNQQPNSNNNSNTNTNNNSNTNKEDNLAVAESYVLTFEKFVQLLNEDNTNIDIYLNKIKQSFKNKEGKNWEEISLGDDTLADIISKTAGNTWYKGNKFLVSNTDKTLPKDFILALTHKTFVNDKVNESIDNNISLDSYNKYIEVCANALKKMIKTTLDLSSDRNILSDISTKIPEYASLNNKICSFVNNIKNVINPYIGYVKEDVNVTTTNNTNNTPANTTSNAPVNVNQQSNTPATSNNGNNNNNQPTKKDDKKSDAITTINTNLTLVKQKIDPIVLKWSNAKKSKAVNITDINYADVQNIDNSIKDIDAILNSDDENAGVNAGIRVDLNMSDIMEIVRLFNKAYKLHTTQVIPTGRTRNPHGLDTYGVSNRVFREYESFGGGSPSSAGSSGGPYRNRKLFDIWESAVFDCLRDKKFSKLFTKMVQFSFNTSKNESYIYEADNKVAPVKDVNYSTKHLNEGGKILYQFINEMLDGDTLYKTDGKRGSQYKLIEKYFGLREDVVDKSMSDDDKKTLEDNQKLATNIPTYSFRKIDDKKVAKALSTYTGENMKYTLFKVTTNNTIHQPLYLYISDITKTNVDIKYSEIPSDFLEVSKDISETTSLSRLFSGVNTKGKRANISVDYNKCFSNEIFDTNLLIQNKPAIITIDNGNDISNEIWNDITSFELLTTGNEVKGYNIVRMGCRPDGKLLTDSDHKNKLLKNFEIKSK